MQYLLMIFEDETKYGDDPNSQAWQDIVAAHGALAAEMEAAGVLRGGAGLMATNLATTVRRQGQKVTIHDGPWAETREQLGGYYVIDVPDLDSALGWAKRIPMLGDGSVEIRPTIPEEPTT
ncbi:hypothetical protein C7S18_18945 [Ahniella affigens]|uniref:YCII-related domain-containing protein n=1 Tax=Ahniella affigens TaxID=2021234 RepID=A0A2P1PZB3_9GAMM|nr:YciI family protein [Ahniella affigens]AVQ00189.1 hypothetical protein C7S18_18945 [Ahniella affigens]